MRFRDSKLKFVKVLLCPLVPDTEAHTAFHCITLICRMAYWFKFEKVTSLISLF